MLFTYNFVCAVILERNIIHFDCDQSLVTFQLLCY
jgi:hypothetical protein